MSEEYVTKSISIPRSVADRVAAEAERERRTFSNMVAVLCEASLPALGLGDGRAHASWAMGAGKASPLLGVVHRRSWRQAQARQRESP